MGISAIAGIETQQMAEQRLINQFELDQGALPGINGDKSAVDQAYERHEKAIAYRLEEPQSEEEI